METDRRWQREKAGSGQGSGVRDLLPEYGPLSLLPSPVDTSRRGTGTARLCGPPLKHADVSSDVKFDGNAF